MDMNFVDFFGGLFQISFGVWAGTLLTAKLIWPQIESLSLKIKNMGDNRATKKEFLSLQLNAFERLLIFVNRISPKELMFRNHQAGLSVQQFKHILLAEIETEFQHNWTQQLYVSDVAWAAVLDIKQQTVKLLKHVAAGLDAGQSIDQYIALSQW